MDNIKHQLNGWYCIGKFIGTLDDNNNDPVFYEGKSSLQVSKFEESINRYLYKQLSNMEKNLC